MRKAEILVVGLLLGMVGTCFAGDEVVAETGCASGNKEDVSVIKPDASASETDKAGMSGDNSNDTAELKPAKNGPTWENDLRFEKLKFDEEDLAAAHPIKRKAKAARYINIKW